MGTLDGVDAVNLTLDTSDKSQFLRTKIRSGTYAVDANGRETMAGLGGGDSVCWIVSPNEFLCIFTVRLVPLGTRSPVCLITPSRELRLNL